MPRKSKAALSTQKTWEERINRAKQVRKTWKDLFKVDLARDYLDGKQRPANYSADEWITVNNVYSHLKAQLPALYSADPYFYVSVKRSYEPIRAQIEMMEKRAKVRQSNLNYYRDELKLKKKARLAIQDAMFSYGVLRVEHVSTLVENPDAGKAVMRERPDDADDSYEDEPMVDADGNEIMEPDMIPVNSRYNIARVHPDDFLWDEDAGPLEESWAWVAERMRVPYEDVAANKMFKKSAVKSLRGKSGEKEDDESKTREDRKKGDIQSRDSGGSYFKTERDEIEPEICILWKIFDLKKKRWLVIGEGGEEPLLDEDEYPPGVEESPYSVLRFTLRDDSPYPIPPMSQGIDPAREYNIARSDILKHRKRFNRKYEILVSAFDDVESEISKLESGEDGTCIKKNLPTPAVTPIADAPLDQMRWTELGYLRNEMIELFGGATGEARGIAEADSATQSAILDQRLQLKEGDALSDVVDWLKEVAKKLDQLIQAHIDVVQAVRISGPDGKEYMEIITPDDYGEINGEYQYEIYAGSTQPKLPQMEKLAWMEFMKILGQVPTLGMERDVVRHFARLLNLDNDSLVDAVVRAMTKAAQMLMQGKSAPAQGSSPNVPENNPSAALGGIVGEAASPQPGQ